MRLPRIETLPLVDHHCHGLVRRALDRADFERAMTEADQPAPPATSFFDSQLGFALRRWCAPVLDLPAHAPPDDYLDRRAELGPDEVANRLLRAAGIEDFCVDTGFAPERLTSSAELAAAAGARAHDVVRLEPLAEQVALDIVTGQVGVAHFPDLIRSRLAARTGRAPAGSDDTGVGTGDVGAVAVKSVAAYRVGLELPAERPTDRAVIAAVRGWVSRLRAGAPIRLADPVLHSFLIWTGADLGLPVQIHTGYGDTDLHLARANPLLLTDLLRALAPTGAPVVLLHCYPYHREAGYLAQVFPQVYLDVGLATHNVGRASATVLAEALELAPFGKMLFSTDAFALAELYLLGARLFRRALGSFLLAGIEADDWTVEDAQRVATMIGSGNARRVYGLPESAVAEPTLFEPGLIEPVSLPGLPGQPRGRQPRPAPTAGTPATRRPARAAAAPAARRAMPKKAPDAAAEAVDSAQATAGASTPAEAGSGAAAHGRETSSGDASAEGATAAETPAAGRPAAEKASGRRVRKPAAADPSGPPTGTTPGRGRPAAGRRAAPRSRRQAPPISLIKEPRGKEHHRSAKPPRSRTHGTAAHPKSGETG